MGQRITNADIPANDLHSICIGKQRAVYIFVGIVSQQLQARAFPPVNYGYAARCFFAAIENVPSALNLSPPIYAALIQTATYA